MVAEQISSPFILQKIRETSWISNSYIDELSRMHRLMSKSKLGFFSIQMFFILKQRYPQEYLSLLNEQNPELNEKEIVDQKKIEKEKRDEKESRQKIENIRQEKKDLEKWIAYYGNP